jgi:Exocyst complex component Sec10
VFARLWPFGALTCSAPLFVWLLPQLGQRMHSVLLDHMQRYVYTGMGALQWKRDVTEYSDCVRDMKIPEVDELFAELQVRVCSSVCLASSQERGRSCHPCHR